MVYSNIANSDVIINGFRSPFRNDRADDGYGGVAVYVKYDIPRVGRKTLKNDSIKSKISSKTSGGKKDSTKRHYHRHHQRHPGEQPFPIHVVTG